MKKSGNDASGFLNIGTFLVFPGLDLMFRPKCWQRLGIPFAAQRSGKRFGHGAIPVLSKKGKADLRYALFQAAMIASTRNRDFITSFTNKLKGREREKGIKTKMRVKLSAKLLTIAWAIMKKKEPFNPEFLTID